MEPTTVLVVEDNRDHAELITAVFATGLSHVNVRVASTGKEARGCLLQEDLPNLITLDLSLPDTNGLEILEWLSGDRRLADIPVVMFTSSSDPEDARRAYSLGARCFMQKPSDFGALVGVVKEILGRWTEAEADSSKCG